MSTMQEDVLKVPHPEDMADDTFYKHMSKRHKDSLGGMPMVYDMNNPHLTEAWRKFHDRLHEIRVDLVHEHLD
jgi:hypothetical protein